MFVCDKPSAAPVAEPKGEAVPRAFRTSATVSRLTFIKPCLAKYRAGYG